VDAVVYLTVDAVIALHTIALEIAGGIDGIRSQQQLASAVAQPQQSAFGEDLYRTIPDKAAAYGYFIAEGQPFLDGNKRTALLALETFLEANGCELEAGDDSVAQLFEDLAKKVVDEEAFFTCVSDHAHPR
jgi:death-on-curing protein